MPTLIEQRVFASGTKMLLRQEACEFTRPLSIGNNWNTIRVAMMWAINGASTGTGSIFSQWALGLCNGSNGYAQKYTDHFVGWGCTAGSPATYTANSGNPYYVYSSRAIRKVGFTSALQSIGGTNINVASTVGTTGKTMVIVDIVKGAAAFTTTAYSTAVGLLTQVPQPRDLSVREFLEALQTPGAPVVQGVSMLGTTGQTLSGTESAGALDTFNFYTENLTTPTEIYAMAVYRML